MPWVTPEFTKGEVDRAGRALSRVLIDDDAARDSEHPFQVISNWRLSHSFPLNTFKLWLLNKASYVDEHSLVAQRLKRLSSIYDKLQRFKKLNLSEMQDIAGCRAIVSTVHKVDQLVWAYKTSDLKHKLVDQDDYIRRPKTSGYRSYHLIYRYFSDRKSTYNELKVEIQIRSRLQHAWATAVETVGTFIQKALKSSRGPKEWLRFFALMGSEIAWRERTSPVPGTPFTHHELKHELRRYAQHLDVENHLRIYAEALQTPVEESTKNARYFLVELDSDAKRVRVTGYKSNELTKASDDYLAVERKTMASSARDAVLVSVESISALRRAYPNYFLDTHRFIEAVNKAIAPEALEKRRPRGGWSDDAQMSLFP